MNNCTNDSDEASLPLVPQRMSTCVPGLTARLRDLGVCYVRMEYKGENFHGDFVHMEYLRTDGSEIRPLDPTVHATSLKVFFRAVLSQRHPNWSEGKGSTGDFRWELSTDSLTHTHYTRGENGNERATYHNL